MNDDIVIRNEFAFVRVQLRDPGGRPRLRVEDVRTGQTIELDAIELESLAWARHRDLAPLLDPSRTRWGKELDHDRNSFAHSEMDLRGVWGHL